jgi:hypothetical protein
MKRAREQEADPGEDNSVLSSATTHSPNEFGQWLLENIYRYADARDSDELAALKEELAVVKRHRDGLLQRMRDITNYDSYRVYPWFCWRCGDTDVREHRRLCGRCRARPVPCSTCKPAMCASKRHNICDYCKDDEEEESSDSCEGNFPDFCN